MSDALVPGAVQRLEASMRDYGLAVKQACFAYLGDLQLAEDAAQETFVRLYGAICKGRFDALQNGRAYALRIAVSGQRLPGYEAPRLVPLCRPARAGGGAAAAPRARAGRNG